MGGKVKHYKGGLVLARKHLPLSIFVYRWWWRWTKTKLNVGKSMIPLFLHRDLGRDVASRPAASRSYRNLVETCRYIGNNGLLLLEWWELNEVSSSNVQWKNVIPTLALEGNASKLNVLNVHQKNLLKDVSGDM